MKGKFYGVSVGPGDPEYMTLKAVRVLGECPVIAAPRTEQDRSVALEIASLATDLSAKEVLHLDFLMSRDREAVAERHRQLAALISSRLDRGQNVAMVNLGDASVYATHSYIHKLISAAGYETETVAGVTSFSACAARLGVSLTEPRKPLRIIPGDYSGLEEELGRDGTKVVMKHGKGLDRVKEALKHSGLYERAALVQNCGMENELVCRDLDSADSYGYFSTIIVGGEE
ncbi:MAG: precorrin-2 C20-methyltransferase [Paenibacillaceae bacterium]|jgi:precorrin-2/cobalt-factor-2 C20-methyltransferase|nr:precorrin-2 C20-methyltransferase [Paenibacillaceae bacterium]